MPQQRDVMEYDVVVVGGGPAGLACALRLRQIDPERNVCVLEKGAQVGAHVLAGAVIEPEPLDELVPGWRESPFPICVPAKRDEFLWLSMDKSRRLPTPPQMNNDGNFIVSLVNLTAWLAEKAEAEGVEIYPGFAAQEALIEDGRVVGVRTGDMGVNKNGEPKDGYTPGIEIRAPVTVLAEGCRGSVSKHLIREFQLDRDADPQTYGIGLKELWQLPSGRAEPGLAQHSVGWPLDNATYGGGFIYHLDQDRVAIGFVVGLDYADPKLDPYERFQQFKHHPDVKPLLEGGEIVSAGARALVEGGWQSLPRLEMPGALLVGDAAGTLNVPKIKGTHTAMRSGMLAAEHLHAQSDAAGFDAALRDSAVAAELKRVRNIRPGFHRGLWAGMGNAAWETLSGGKSPWTLHNIADWRALDRVDRARDSVPPLRERDLPPRDRLAGVYFAATEHDEDQPVHLRITDPSVCTERCTTEYANPCTRFCPAGVYEMVADGDGGQRLQINAANCVHCKTCDIKDPYQVIEWVPPEGGAGPNYQNL